MIEIYIFYPLLYTAAKTMDNDIQNKITVFLEEMLHVRVETLSYKSSLARSLSVTKKKVI